MMMNDFPRVKIMFKIFYKLHPKSLEFFSNILGRLRSKVKKEEIHFHGFSCKFVDKIVILMFVCFHYRS